jgi:hypothetical protein
MVGVEKHRAERHVLTLIIELGGKLYLEVLGITHEPVLMWHNNHFYNRAGKTLRGEVRGIAPRRGEDNFLNARAFALSSASRSVVSVLLSPGSSKYLTLRFSSLNGFIGPASSGFYEKKRYQRQN